MNICIYNFYDNFNHDNAIFDPDSYTLSDGAEKPVIELRNKLNEMGHSLSTIDQLPLEDFDKFIFLDFPTHNISLLQLLKLKDKDMYLILLESEIIKPDNWEINNFSYFKKVFGWKELKQSNYIRSMIPQNFDYVNTSIPFSNRKLVCIFASNKNNSNPRELYSERRRIIKWFENNAVKDFSLYGKNWQTNIKRKKNIFKGKIFSTNDYFNNSYISYKGDVKHKRNVLGGYKFNICLENVYGIDGYITEKIFDAIFSGVVPIYYGASDVLKFIPKELFINYTDFKNVDQLYSFIKGMHEDEWKKYIQAAELYLKSDKATVFSPKYFAEKIASVICENCVIKKNDVMYFIRNKKIENSELEKSNIQISICIPAYNAARYLPAMLDSIINQSYKNLEIIVSDNASTDSTREVVESYIRHDKRIKYQCNKENIGYVRNIEKTVRSASNEIITIFHADDLYEPDIIEKELTVLLQYPEISAVFTKYRHFWGWEPDNRNETREIWENNLKYNSDVGAYFGKLNDFTPILLEYGNPFCCPSFMTRKSEYLHLGGFTDNYPSNEDLELWIKYLKEGKELAIVASTLVNYRHSPEQGSSYWDNLLDLPVFYKVIDEMILPYINDFSSSQEIYLQKKASKLVELTSRVSIFNQKHRTFRKESMKTYRFPFFSDQGFLQRFPLFYYFKNRIINNVYSQIKNKFRQRFPTIFKIIKKAYYKIFSLIR